MDRKEMVEALKELKEACTKRSSCRDCKFSDERNICVFDFELKEHDSAPAYIVIIE